MPYTVKLTYFKLRGKFYSEGEYESQESELFEIVSEVRRMLQEGRLPGLQDGCSDFSVLVDVPDHPNNYYSLVIPDFLHDFLVMHEDQELFLGRQRT